MTSKNTPNLRSSTVALEIMPVICAISILKMEGGKPRKPIKNSLQSGLFITLLNTCWILLTRESLLMPKYEPIHDCEPVKKSFLVIVQKADDLIIRLSSVGKGD